MTGGALGWYVDNLSLAAPLSIGFVAIWLLLPQSRQQPRTAAAVAGLAALAVGWFGYLQPTGQATLDFLFVVFSGVAVISAACMISQSNPLYAALYFSLVILGTCGLFLILSAPFLAAATVIVYAGAIIVTFLFVMMLARPSGATLYDRQANQPMLASLAGFVFLGALLTTIQETFPGAGQPRHVRERESLLDAANELQAVAERWRSTPEGHLQPAANDLANEAEGFAQRVRERVAAAATPLPAAPPQMWETRFSNATDENYGTVNGLGRSLFGDYLWAVELAGALLTIAIVGAIVIAPQRAGTHS